MFNRPEGVKTARLSSGIGEFPVRLHGVSHAYSMPCDKAALSFVWQLICPQVRGRNR